MKTIKYEEVKRINREEEGRPNWISLSSNNYISGYMIPQEDYEIKLFNDYKEAKEYCNKMYGIRIPNMHSKTEYSKVDEIGDFEKVDCNHPYKIQFFNRYNYCLDMGVNLIDIRKQNYNYTSRIELIAFNTLN